MNNFISLALSYILEITGEEDGAALYVIIIYGASVIGIVSYLIFRFRNRGSRLSDGSTVLSPVEKIRGFFFNIPMISAFLLMLYITSNYVEFGR